MPPAPPLAPPPPLPVVSPPLTPPGVIPPGTRYGAEAACPGEGAAFGPTGPDLHPPSQGAERELADALAGGGDVRKLAEKGEERRLRIGTVEVDLDARQVRVPGRFCLDTGILEYLAVGPRGKAYESVFVLNARGLHLQLGLVLVGLEPFPAEKVIEALARRAEPTPEARGKAPAVVVPQSARLQIRVETPDTPDTPGAGLRPLASFLTDRATGRPPADGYLQWFFSGSTIQEGRLVADYYEQYVALWPDPVAVVNALEALPNPYRSAAGLEVRKASGLVKGTRVVLVFEPVGKPGANGRPEDVTQK